MKRIMALVLACIMLLPVHVVLAEDSSQGQVNIAAGRSISASTQYSDGTAPKYATDGDEGTIYHNGSQEVGDLINGNQVLLLDLGADYNVSRVVVKSRRDLDQAPMRTGWIVEAACLPSFKDAVIIGEKPNPGDFKSDLTINFKEPLKARYISVRSINDFFCIAELEVYGEKYAGKVAPVFGDVGDRDYNAVQLLYNLGVMSGISQTEFGTKNLIRREEAAKIVAQAGGIAPSATTTSYFEDVKDDNVYLAYINACVEKGIISNASTFRPRDYVKGVELLKMLEAAMDYNDILDCFGEYPQNVVELASELEITKGVEFLSNEPISKVDAAKIIYNALLTNVSVIEGAAGTKSGFVVLYSEGESLIKKAFGYSLKKGIISENGITSLYEENDLGINCVKINNEKYYDENGSLFDFIGQAVYYITDDENNILSGWEDKQRNDVYVVYTKDIDMENTTISMISVLDEEDETTEYDLEDMLCVLKNGVAFNDFDKDALDFVNGKIELIDNNGDGIIDVLHIWEPQVIVADSAKQNEGRVFISGLNGTGVDISNYKRLRARANGRPTDIGEVSTGNLVYAYVSENKESVCVDVIKNSVSGVVTNISTNSFSVDNTDYGFSDYYLLNKDKMENLTLGKKATFILDEHDSLVWIDSADLGMEEDVLGFIQAFDVAKGYKNSFVKIYNENSKFETLELADKIKIDGTVYTQSDINEVLTQNQSIYAGKVVLYRVNSDGQVRYMDTENYDRVKEADSKLVDMGVSLTDGSCRVPDGIYSSHKMMLPILSDFPMFVIPTDRNMKPLINKEYEMFYNVSTVNSKIPNGEVRLSGETRFFGKDEFGSPSLGVNLYVIDESLSSVGFIKSVYTDGFIVDSVTKKLNSDKEVCYSVTGFDLAEKRKRTLVLSEDMTKVLDSYRIYADSNNPDLSEAEKPNSAWFTTFRLINSEADLTGIDKYMSDVNTLKRGDIVRLEVSGSEVTALECVFKYNKNDPEYKIHYSAGDLYMDVRSTFRLNCAQVQSYKKNILTINSQSSGTESLNCANVTGGFYVCTDKRIIKCELSDIASYLGEDSQVVVITKAGRAHSIIAFQ